MSDSQPRPDLATAIAVAVLAVGLVGFALSDLGDLTAPLALILAGCAIGAELIGQGYPAQPRVTRSFAGAMPAGGFLGPAPAFVIPVLAYTAGWLVERYRVQAL